MALVVGGIPFGGDFQALRGPILVTLASGALLLGLDLAKNPASLTQGFGRRGHRSGYLTTFQVRKEKWRQLPGM